MNKLIWKVRFALYMHKHIWLWSWRFCWDAACTWADEYDWQDMHPHDAVHEEFSNWSD